MSDTNSAIKSSAAVFGDVTSLTLATLPHTDGTTTEILLGSTGSQLHLFLLPDCQHLFSQTVLPNAARCHGIATCSLSSPSQTAFTTLIAVHGDRHVNVFALDPSRLSDQLELVVSLPRLISWTMAVSIYPWKEKNTSNIESIRNAVVAVGLSDNSVELYNINCSRLKKVAGGGTGGGGRANGESVKLIKRVECTDRCLLYSMDLFLNVHTGVCYVAGGTIFLDVVIWKADFKNLEKKNGIAADSTVNSFSSSSSSSSLNFTSSFSNVQYRLKGHEGSIHTVRWSPSGNTLASGSDDRTVRIWDILENGRNSHKIIRRENGNKMNGVDKGAKGEENGCNEVYLSPRKVLYGHLARLWGFFFTQDESIVISCSEDRTCKFWNIGIEPTCSEEEEEEEKKKSPKKENVNFATLKGHRFRGVWHCCLSGSILYTGGADGAIKAWNLWDVLQPEYVERILNSKSSSSAISHSTALGIGRGRAFLPSTSFSPPLSGTEDVYTCTWTATSLQCNLPDPKSAIVGTITLASAVKKAAAAAESTIAEQDFKNLPKAAFDSSSEWVRCLAVTKDHSTVFVATNRGLVHQVQLPVVPLVLGSTAAAAGTDPQEESWLTIYASVRKRPITSIKLVEEDCEVQKVVHVSLCDISGYATVLTRQNIPEIEKQQDGGSAAGWSFQEWLPYSSGPVSGIHFLRTGISDTLLFTTGPQGKLTLWQLRVKNEKQGGGDITGLVTSPTAREVPLRLAESCCELKKSTKIVELDILLTTTTSSSSSSSSIDNTATWLIAAGTSCGAVVNWRLKVETDGPQPRYDLQLLSRLKDVHLGSPIRSISLLDSGGVDSNTTVLESCGSNGAIVRFSVNSMNGKLSIMVEEHYDALLIVAGKVFKPNSNNDNNSPRKLTSPPKSSKSSQLVYGFQSTNFVVWDAKAEAEVCSLYCGSWRRPWAVQISAADTMTFCCDRGVGGTKINVYTRRPLVLQQGDKNSNDDINRIAPYPRALLPPGHGREINAVGIRALGGISHFESKSAGKNNKRFACFTGGEDSSVRQTLIDFSKNPSLRETNLISDHVGGTTVKSLTMVDFFSSGGGVRGNARDGDSPEENRKKTLMVTGGSKKVLMAWILQQNDGNLQNSAAAVASEDGFHCQFVSSHAMQNIISCKNLPSGKPISAIENRYLAISAIVPTNSPNSPSPTHAFILAGCSNGPIELLAIPLDPGIYQEGGPTSLAGTWHLVALLQYHTCPVISTQTLNPKLCGAGGDNYNSCYVAFSAGTDGACAVWDLSSCIQAYLAQQRQAQYVFKQGEQAKGINNWKAHNLHPISVISSVHQSGINGMSAAQINSDYSLTTSSSSLSSGGAPAGTAATHAAVMLVTVGDDQGLTASLVTFTLSNSEDLLSATNNMTLSSPSATAVPSPSPPLTVLECTLNAQVKEPNAHSSAARDVWTDGETAFSTGLDQKVRKWEIERFSMNDGNSAGVHRGGGGGGNSVSLRIKETGCVVTQVLEPLSLDVAVVSPNSTTENGIGGGGSSTAVVMKVAVAGRGLQVIEW
ncbi:hypothetical protein Ndes2437B_g00690 [Nannochloris sp. 'desiccata']